MMKWLTLIMILISGAASGQVPTAVKITNNDGSKIASPTAAGTSATVAFPVQGVTGGTPMPVTCISGCGSAATDVAANAAANETLATRAAVTAALRLIDTAQLAGSQLVPWRGDQAAGAWVQIKAAIPAGAAIIGKVGIDQTTPGTTNGVQINAAIPAGGNTIGNVGLVAGVAIVGKFGIDQTTPGTTNLVAVSNSFALDATLTGGSQIAQIKSGLKGASAAALVTSTANGVDHQGLDVQIQNATVSTNQTQWAGTAVDVNSGTKSAGTLRVVLATDQPALTNKLLVTPDSVALPANQSVNVTQWNGTTAVTGSGTATGALRVEIANNGTGLLGLNAGTAIVGKVGIDQTTMGTTNGVVAMPTTVAGAALSQKVFTANTTLNIKASAGNVYGWSAINAAAAVCWLQFYNTAGNPTCGTSVIWSVPLPVTPGVSNFIPANLPLQNHATGIGICVSTTATGGTTCGSTASGTIFYQ